ncbi:MAG: AAA family ATPase [Candidatus Pacearchaeota archaeon]
MKLKKIWLENIRSYNKQEIEFPSGSLLLSGDIGSGKSTILLAVEFALFGLLKGRSGTGLLKNGRNSGTVKLNFEIDGKDIIIERKLKKIRDSVSQDKCRLKIDGEEKEISSNEAKSKILELLNYPQEFMNKNPILFRYTVYTAQEEMKNILLEDSDTRMNILRRVFDIDKYKIITENINKITSRLRSEIRSKEGIIADLNSKKDELKTKENEMKKIKGDLAVAKSKHDDILAIVKERRNKLDEIEIKMKELNSLRTEFARKESEIIEKKNAIKKSKEEIEILKNQISVLEKEIKPIEVKNFSDEIKIKEQNLMENEKKFIEINKKIAILETEKLRNEKISSEIAKLGECPTCKQNVPEEHKIKIKKKSTDEILRINSEIIESIKEKEDILKSVNKIKEEIAILKEKEKEASIIKIKMENLREKQSRERMLADFIVQEEIKIIENEKVLKDLSERIKILANSEKNYITVKSLLTEAIEEERNLAIIKAKAEKQIEGIEKAIGEILKEISEKEKIKEKIIYLKRLERWLSEDFLQIVSEIEKNVMIKVHYEFSQLFKKWFSMLAEGLSARIDEEFKPIIEQDGYEIEYDYLSGGERTAAALAYRLALNHTINSIMSNIKTKDLLILDEPTDGFSSEQLNKMRDVLSELKAEQIIIVSHEQKIESFVDNIIRLEKKDGVTNIFSS